MRCKIEQEGHTEARFEARGKSHGQRERWYRDAQSREVLTERARPDCLYPCGPDEYRANESRPDGGQISTAKRKVQRPIPLFAEYCLSRNCATIIEGTEVPSGPLLLLLSGFEHLFLRPPEVFSNGR